MAQIPSRDITGKCEGECRDLVRELEIKNQSSLASVADSFEGPVPSVDHARSRNEAPGFLGGHV